MTDENNGPTRPNWLTTEEAADYLRLRHVTAGGLKRWRRHGGGPRFIRTKRRVFYDIADLDDWLQSFQSKKQS